MAGYRISVPATSANLGPGYDQLGLALDWRMELQARPADDWSVTIEGYGAEEFPRDARNLVIKTYLEAWRGHAAEPVKLALHMNNTIPPARGMGSSSAALISALTLAHLFQGRDLDRDALFAQAAAMEGHPDNVAPTVYGGLQICGRKDDAFFTQSGPIHPSLRLVLVVPDMEASTEEMRAALPATWPQADLDYNRDLVTQLIAGIATADPQGLRCSELDRIHQPYRFKIQALPHAIFQELSRIEGVHGAFLSGSGPTIAAWVKHPFNPIATLQERMGDRLAGAVLRVVDMDQQGVVVTPL